jgi:hypothetical protein
MAVEKLGLLDLIRPQYLAGMQFPDGIEEILDVLGVDSLHTVLDAHQVEFFGVASFEGAGDGASEVRVVHPAGAGFTWERRNLRFRLTIPRDGAAFINAAATGTDGQLPQVRALFDDLLPIEEDTGGGNLVATEYPGTRYRLELQVEFLNFNLGEDWRAGMFDPVTKRVVPDPDPRYRNQPVRLILPKVQISITQGDDANNFAPTFALESWGAQGFDSVDDLKTGEFIRMDPPIALNKSNTYAFSIDQIVLDLSKDSTPPELLANFGIGDEWTGIYIKQLLFYYCSAQGGGFNVRVKDALFGFDKKVSFEFGVDVYLNAPIGGRLSVRPQFYNAQERVTHRDGVVGDSVATPPSGQPGGSATVKVGGALQLVLEGNAPPFTVSVLVNGAEAWNTTSQQVIFNTAGDFNVFIRVTDTRGRGYSNYIKVTVQPLPLPAQPSGSDRDRPASTDPAQPLSFSRVNNDATHDVTYTESGTRVTMNATGGSSLTFTVREGTSVVLQSTGRQVSLDVPNGSNYTFEVAYPGTNSGNQPAPVSLPFLFNRPSNAEIPTYVNGSTDDSAFTSAFLNQIQNATRPTAAELASILIDGYASNDPSNPASDLALSNRRAEVMRQKLAALYPGVTINTIGHGQVGAVGDASNRRAVVSYTLAVVSPLTITGTLVRPAAPIVPPPPPASATPLGAPPTPAPASQQYPPALKQFGLRFKLERNELSLFELYARIDFKTQLQSRLNSGITTNTGNPPSTTESDALTQQNGEVDFILAYMFDRALSENTFTLTARALPGNTEGLLRLENNTNRDNRLLNTFGALLLFAPIINSAATSAATNSQNAGAWIGLGASVAVPVAIGLLNVFRMRKTILHGIEGRVKYVVPPDGEPLRSFDFGIFTDYEVQFDVIVEALGIGQNRLPGSNPLPPPLRARYKAIGFNIHYQDDATYKGWNYAPIFDSSKGYDLDLSDPSLFALPAPLGNLFAIAGARLARFNPVTLEVDFQFKVDLGVITVDKFKLKIPLDPTGPPQILPSGVKVNIPGVLKGQGFVEIIDTNVTVTAPDGSISTAASKGVEGGIDLTLIALKIRIQASIGIGTLRSPEGREAVSVFVGLSVEFPTPIVLGATGLGIYGFTGLFAMHYKRLEEPRDPTKAVGPALEWLIKAEGQAHKLKNSAGARLWGPDFDKWSFGIGIILGSIDGGILFNMQGMFVLELPGPRILIMVKMRIVSPLPELSDTAELAIGIIGVIDLDFYRKQITLGVMINFEIRELLSISLPIELFFKLDDPSNWHLYIGTIAQPASAEILGIVRGSAYLMMQGNQLRYADYGSRVPEFLRDKVLNPFAIAMGLEASLLLGSESARIYLRLSAGAHLGVSFSPFMVVGTMYFSGELRLVIISIGAHGHFDVLVSKIAGSNDYKVYLHGEVCGSIDFFFFEISACIGLTIGNESFDLVPPPLVRGMYLQSFSPVLTSGQGTQRPIDASLGNGAEISGGGAIPASAPTVPIDSVIVLQLQAPPVLGLSGPSFMLSPGTCPDLRPGGWIVLSESVKVKYTINSITLQQGGAAYGGSNVPSVWRIERNPNGTGADTAVDLALFSRTPTSTEHAFERSTDLNTNLEIRWANLCKPPAPPASVFYAFCKHPLGPRAGGWNLKGSVKPDPAGTVRIAPVDNTMRVFQPYQEAIFNLADFALGQMGQLYDVPAQIVGLDPGLLHHFNHPVRNCYVLSRPIKGYSRNPLIVEDALAIYSAAEVNHVFDKGAGFLDFFPAKDNTPLRTQFRRIGKTTALSMREVMRIDILEAPADQVVLTFLAYRAGYTLILTAYNAEHQIVQRKRLRPKRGDTVLSEPQHVSLTGEGIKYILITNKLFTGLLDRICIVRGALSGLTLPSKVPCLRALQLPWLNLTSMRDQQNNELLERLRDYLERKHRYPVTIFETDAFDSVLVYAAVQDKFLGKVLVETLDKNGHVLESFSLVDLIIQHITHPATQLPADWRSSSLPWREGAFGAATLFSIPPYNSYKQILFRLRPNDPQAVAFQINTLETFPGQPVMLVGAFELLTAGEVAHAATVTAVLESERETLTGYLNNNTPVPLLVPNSEYRLTVNYTTTVHNSQSGEHSNNHSQTYGFRTDAAQPSELGPYVLGATPDLDERFHFFADPVKVVFNDPSFQGMLSAYGKAIRVVIRSADGQPVANSPDTAFTTEEVEASVLTPYRDTIMAMVEAGLLPCAGSIDLPQHIHYTSPFILRPLMAYTLDIELTPAAAAGAVVKPFYRRAFSTSRFSGLADFTASLRIASITQKAMRSLPVGMPSAPVSPANAAVMTDKAFDDLLSSCGLMASASPDEVGFTLLWANQAGDFQPYAILIRASEPLWRFRTESVKRDVRDARNMIIDPNFKIYENVPVPDMELASIGAEGSIDYFVRNTTGTLTLARLRTADFGPVPRSVTIMAVKPASTFYNTPAESHQLIRLSISNKAPWEE